jgi:hypothetical protein
VKVECTKIISLITGEVGSKSHSLDIGGVYVVLALSTTPERHILLRVVRSDGFIPALFDSRQFKTICSKIPSNWVATIDEAGHFKLTPERWLRPGFWEDYFNAMPEAVKEFEEEKAKIIAESG